MLYLHSYPNLHSLPHAPMLLLLHSSHLSCPFLNAFLFHIPTNYFMLLIHLLPSFFLVQCALSTTHIPQLLLIHLFALINHSWAWLLCICHCLHNRCVIIIPAPSVLLTLCSLIALCTLACFTYAFHSLQAALSFPFPFHSLPFPHFTVPSHMHISISHFSLSLINSSFLFFPFF